MRPLCVALIACLWLLDLATPQLFIVAVLLSGPIALSSLAAEPRFTSLLVWLAIGADVSAGYANGVMAHHVDPIAVADRAISACSFLLVGGLSVASQRAARRAGAFAARSDRAARERAVGRAIETIRLSVNPELIARSIVREVPGALDVDDALLAAFERGRDEPATFRCARGGEVTATRARPSAGLLSFAQSVAERREIVPLEEAGAVGRLVLDELGAVHAIAAPVLEHGTVYGVVILARREQPFEPGFTESLRSFADRCGVALAQAELFAQLAERNAALGTANAALLERSDVIRDLVYALSHDLRTPLAAAGMTMRQALEGAYGEVPARLRAILERSVLSNDELQRLAETLVLVSRYEAGEASLRREPARLATLARAAVDELESLWRGKGLAVALEAPEDPEVVADASELRRAIVNLLANAIAFTPAGRQIVVRLRVAGADVALDVDDDGYGVPVAQRSRLFERLAADVSRQGAGTGLGLYIVRRIAEAHGGSARYAPKASGGSIFTVSLPLAVRPAIAAEMAE